MDTVAVIDFETTGMTPEQGARATEIAVVLIRDGVVIDRYASLMHSGAWVPPFIEQLTGISNAMLADAPPSERVMREVADFVGDAPMAAHNAAFDSRFWAAELARAGQASGSPFACTLLLSRRLYPDAPSHKLGNLGRWAGLPDTGRAHRALADAEMAARLLLRMEADLLARYPLEAVTHSLLCELQTVSRRGIARFLEERPTRMRRARG
jgi:DNA polymerase-3 subunit epsilon